MKDIAFHITDIAENGIRAGARRIAVRLRIENDALLMDIDDDGSGMDRNTLERAADPFCTTRTTRKVGLGLPFLFQNAEQCGGWARVDSEPGKGTRVEALFPLGDLDCPPAGDLAGTLMQLIVGHPHTEISIALSCGDRSDCLSTHEVTEALGDLPPGHPKAALCIREILSQMLLRCFGARLQ